MRRHIPATDSNRSIWAMWRMSGPQYRVLLASTSPAAVPPRRRHFDPGVHNSPNDHREGSATGPLRVRASGGKNSAPGPPPVVLCKRHGRVDFRRIICECAVKWLHPPNQPHYQTYYAAAATVGLVRASPGPFAYFFIAMAMVVAFSHQDFADGHWRLAILLGSLSD